MSILSVPSVLRNVRLVDLDLIFWYKSAAYTAQTVSGMCKLPSFKKQTGHTELQCFQAKVLRTLHVCACILSASHFMNFNLLGNSPSLHEKITSAKVNYDDARYLSIFLLMQEIEAGL